jgi:hypothetical protein
MISDDLLRLHSIKSTDRIGIMLSGGMDSALLLYLLAKNVDNILPFTVPKTDGAKHYVGPIIDWVNQRLNKQITQTKFIGNQSVYHEHIINLALKSIENEYDILYFAGNSYPKDILPNGPNRIRRNNPKHHQPFFDLYKTDVVQAYVEYDIMDLLKLTHTCTELEFGRCSNCWQCNERSWAFKKLNLTDIGTL